MKMLSRILSKRNIAPVQLINAQEFEYNEIESSAREASAPRFRFNEIYKKRSFLMDSHRFKILELTVPATGGEIDIRLITPKEVSEAFQKKYSYMHIGAVQVGIKLLARDGIDCSVLCVLQDDRITDFKKSLLGTVEASLCNQVAYFNVFPNFTTHLKDAAHCLRLRIKTDGISMKKGMMELTIDYRIYYKLMSSNVTPNTRFLNSPGITTSVLTNPKNNSQQKHVTKWHEVTFPREWNLTPPVRQLESSNASVYEDMGGKISLQFHRHSFANYEEASTSGTKIVYNEESLEEEDTKRPMRMFQAMELKELYAQAENCDSPEELEKIIKEISQVQLGKKKRKILPYQAAKDEPEPSRASMDTDGERQTPPGGGHTVGDKRKAIDNWVASLKLTQALVLSKYAYEEAHAYYESTLTGIVQKWYQSFKRSSQWTDWAAKMAQTNSPLDFAVPIYAQFCGDITGHSEQSKERAKANIQKLSICNMRYFEEYTNEFQTYYCTIGDIENNDLIRTYYRKLPEPWNDAVSQSLEENPLQYFTVGGIAERDKRTSKVLLAEYEEAIEYANLKVFEVIYSDEENESVYSLEYPSDSETESTSESSEEDEKELGHRPIFVLQIQNWKEENTDIISTFHHNPGRFVCDYCKCDDDSTIPMYCESTGETYHQECFIAELRRKTKDRDAHTLVEEEYNVFRKKEHERNLKEDMKTMKFVTSLSQNKEIKESLESLDPTIAETNANPIIGINPLDSITVERQVNPFTNLLVAEKQEQVMPVQTSIYSNYVTIGLKFPTYRKYHLHAFVDTGSGCSLAKRYAIPEEFWEKSPRTVTGVAMEENKIIMADTLARNVKVSWGGGTFIIKNLWQCKGQTADLLLGNDFLLQQTIIQTSEMIGFEKNNRFHWARLTDAVRVTTKGFTNPYQKTLVKSGDYKAILKPVLQVLQEKLKGHSEILINESTNSEDSESETNSEYQISDDESSDGEEEYIREHNLNVYATKAEQKKIPTLTEIENLLKPVISEDPQLYGERDPVYCQLKMHDANIICHVKAIPHYREEDRKEMESQIQELVEKKLIKPANSPHHAPTFLVRNHAEQLRGKARMVIDYRDVNKKTVKDGYQIAQVRILINRLRGAMIFSKFDAKSSFWQVKILPPLLLPEEGDLIILQTDANDYYWTGVVLAVAPDTNHEKICKFLSGKFNATELNYSTGDKEVLALIKSIKGAEAYLGNRFVVRTDNKRVKNFKNYKLTDAADRGRVLRWQMFLTQYEYDVEMVAGNKNFLPDALTREMTMFDREGRNPRSRKPESEEKKLWERFKGGDKTVGPLHDGPGYQYMVSYGTAEASQSPRIKPKPDSEEDGRSSHSDGTNEDKVVNEFLLCPKGSALTDQSQGKRLASPSQTADGKGISSPLMAAALPKSRKGSLRADKLPLVTGKKVIHNQPLKIFQKPVFRTDRLLAFKQKIIIDNILYSFYEENETHLLHTLKALTEEMYGVHTKDKGVLAEPSKVVYLESPESAKIPMLALKESEWYNFHNLLGEGRDVLPGTLSIIPGPYYERYLVDVQAEHPQKHKLWLIENGFVRNLWTKTNEDLKGFPEIIVEAVKNIRPDGCILRIKFISTPPEWTVWQWKTKSKHSLDESYDHSNYQKPSSERL
ncbi:hypothetical protein ACLB2K_035819 [Fragaria x ananassa]